MARIITISVHITSGEPSEHGARCYQKEGIANHWVDKLIEHMLEETESNKLQLLYATIKAGPSDWTCLVGINDYISWPPLNLAGFEVFLSCTTAETADKPLLLSLNDLASSTPRHQKTMGPYSATTLLVPSTAKNQNVPGNVFLRFSGDLKLEEFKYEQPIKNINQ